MRGGVKHLIELLSTAQPQQWDFDRIVVCGNIPTLRELEVRPWLEKRDSTKLNKGLLQRMLWLRYRLSQAGLKEGCCLLFVPAGRPELRGNFHPVVTMNQNLLPFEIL